MAWAVATCLFWAAVLSITFPRMIAVMSRKLFPAHLDGLHTDRPRSSWSIRILRCAQRYSFRDDLPLGAGDKGTSW